MVFLEDREILAQLPGLLLPWYDGGARVLPWREEPTPYRVWVSEIMLQQTRVEAVRPYYERFLEAFPTVEALAAAPEEKLLKMWEGLGYYNRARNLQRAAQQVVELYDGEVPASYEALRALPGVGDYTAGAIASIAFQLPVPAVDGNVLRVISRVLCRYDNILDAKVKRRTEEELRQALPQRAGDFNQSLMELGALVCLPGGAPRCLGCPLHPVCRAAAQGVAQELPVKAKAKPRKQEERTLFLLFSHQGRVALQKRPEKGLLAGLWELPAAPGVLTESQGRAFLQERGVSPGMLSPGPQAKHVFSHVEWHMGSFLAQGVEESPAFTWAAWKDLRERFPLPSAFKAYVPLLREQLAAVKHAPRQLPGGVLHSRQLFPKQGNIRLKGRGQGKTLPQVLPGGPGKGGGLLHPLGQEAAHVPLHVGKDMLCLGPGGKHPRGDAPLLEEGPPLALREDARRGGKLPQARQQPLLRPLLQSHPPLVGEQQKQGALLLFAGLGLGLYGQLLGHPLGGGAAHGMKGAPQTPGSAPRQAHQGAQLHQGLVEVPRPLGQRLAQLLLGAALDFGV